MFMGVASCAKARKETAKTVKREERRFMFFMLVLFLCKDIKKMGIKRRELRIKL